MTRELKFQTADDFLAFSKACKRAGRKDLRKGLNKGLQAGVKPLLPGAADAFAATMPPGLEDRARHVRQVVQVTTGRDPGVRVGVPYGPRLKGGEHGGMGASNARLANLHGQIRHPLFGKREGPNTWFNTPVPQAVGWYERYWSARAESVRPALDRAMQDIADQVVREAQRGR